MNKAKKKKRIKKMQKKKSNEMREITKSIRKKQAK